MPQQVQVILTSKHPFKFLANASRPANITYNPKNKRMLQNKTQDRIYFYICIYNEKLTTTVQSSIIFFFKKYIFFNLKTFVKINKLNHFFNIKK